MALRSRPVRSASPRSSAAVLFRRDRHLGRRREPDIFPGFWPVFSAASASARRSPATRSMRFRATTSSCPSDLCRGLGCSGEPNHARRRLSRVGIHLDGLAWGRHPGRAPDRDILQAAHRAFRQYLDLASVQRVKPKRVHRRPLPCREAPVASRYVFCTRASVRDRSELALRRLIDLDQQSLR